MKTKQRNILVNLNRTLILVLTMVSLLMDGYEASDLVCTAALIVWLWLPQCTRLEVGILRRIDNKRHHLS